MREYEQLTEKMKNKTITKQEKGNNTKRNFNMSNYPTGAQYDPRAPYNENDENENTEIDKLYYIYL